MSFSSEESKIIKVQAKEFKELISTTEFFIIDVRTPKEFNSGHIKNAINVDCYSQSFQTEIMKYKEDKAILIYCRSGARSYSTAQKLSKNGFNTIYDLQGGILAYQKAGFELIK